MMTPDHDGQLFEGFSNLRGAYDVSTTVTKSLRQALASLSTDIATVAVCGSVKRLEAHSGSDLDFIVVVDDRQKPVPETVRLNLYRNVWESLRTHPELASFATPKPGGLFSVCASWKDLTDGEMKGVIDEPITTFGHRIHLLMDAVAVSGDDRFAELQEDLFEWYQESDVTNRFGDQSPFEWLKQDVLRYWYSLRARSFWLFRDNQIKSNVVNLKLRSSRYLQISAFLLRLQWAQELPPEQQQSFLLQSSERSPLKTICSKLTEGQSSELLAAWQHIWTTLETGQTDSDRSEEWIPHLKTIRNLVEATGAWRGNCSE